MAAAATGTGSASVATLNFTHLCVLDFEATCLDGVRIFPQEVIEFPVVILDIASRQVVGEFHQYVKPTAHPQLSAFCTELTGIQQHTVDSATPFPEVYTSLKEWMKKERLFPDDPSGSGSAHAEAIRYAFVTCGDWDLKTCLPHQLSHLQLASHTCFQQWINLKFAFVHMYGGKPLGMDGMLAKLQMPLVGRHHSGIDDARNIASIAKRMLADGWVPKITSQLR